MKYERIFIDPSDNRTYIDAFVSYSGHTHEAMLILPGGGYGGVCADREGEDVALAYMARGLNCFVLQYRVGTPADRYPRQLIDACRALRYLRTHAAEFHIDPQKIYCVGFSAGGHLAGSLCTMYDRPEVCEALGTSAEDCRPNGAVLSYPVVSACVPATHEGSFENLLGKRYAELTDAERVRYSIERNVTDRTPPMFLWHTAEDDAVPTYGTLALAQTLIEHKIPVRLNLYPYGPHGMALGTKMSAGGYAPFVDEFANTWVDDSLAFLRSEKAQSAGKE
ncbi:MAG: alpha/beta hydrolase [Clostridia bacterium]|nr:alpha/beta hydrolase [Clostridia bacterium]